MKISKVIYELEDVKLKYGDISIAIYDLESDLFSFEISWFMKNVATAKISGFSNPSHPEDSIFLTFMEGPLPK